MYILDLSKEEFRRRYEPRIDLDSVKDIAISLKRQYGEISGSRKIYTALENRQDVIDSILKNGD